MNLFLELSKQNSSCKTKDLALLPASKTSFKWRKHRGSLEREKRNPEGYFKDTFPEMLAWKQSVSVHFIFIHGRSVL